jgi:tRNA pseudouridine55 synthase
LSATSGFLCVDKPCGISSFGAVSHVRRAIGCPKAGHAGTLDPEASGLLLIALGDATRLLPYLPLEPKRYQFGVQFGQMTDTLDSKGTLVKTGGSVPSRAGVEAVFPGFLGSISQVPPEFSAIKVNGRRAYRLARQGQTVELASRTITVHALDLLRYDEATGQALFDVTCSGGTYVRALARDIAAACGTIGFACSIRRMAIGRFAVDKACPMDDSENMTGAILSLYDAFKDQPMITVDGRQIARIRNGSVIAVPEGAVGKTVVTVFAFDSGHNLVAVLKRKTDGTFQPEKVFASEDKRKPEGRIQKSVVSSQNPE